MLSTSNEDLKAQLVAQCLEIFPEAQGLLLWGGSVTPDFSPEVNDIDVIIEIDTDFTHEVVLAERLKTLVQGCTFCRLDPFVYLTGSAHEEPLEFIAPFGFYKANPFIPYLIQNQHELIYGQSRLLKKLPVVTLSQALFGILPQVMGALKRLRMDAQVEQTWLPLLSKHKSYFFVIVRTYFAFEQGGVGSKQESLRFLAKKFPKYGSIVDRLNASLQSPSAQPETSDEPSAELVLEFVRDMETSLQAAKQRETVH